MHSRHHVDYPPSTLYAGLYVLAVNSKVAPLNNPLVKQAMSLAVDREAIVKDLWRERGIVASGPIAKGDPNQQFDVRRFNFPMRRA